MRTIVTTPEIESLIHHHSPIAFGVSGGKDSDTAALAVSEYLDQMKHRGPRILIHSDLGRIEHKDSLPQCQRLAARLGLELVVVHPPNEMVDRWLNRWRANCQRYVELECVKVILPWSTASMRFCTSEEKVAPITSKLKKLFPNEKIINVSGIRREESAKRAKSPIVKVEARLKGRGETEGWSWYPILDWTVEEVFALHDELGFPLHEAYTKWEMSRVSCSLCILSSADDLHKSARIPEHADVYRELVDLEILSTFSFQAKWLGDVAPELLRPDQVIGLAEAKRKAALREAAEARIADGLLYVKGWPVRVPTFDEAQVLAEIRIQIGAMLDLPVRFTEPNAIIARFRELMNEKEQPRLFEE